MDNSNVTFYYIKIQQNKSLRFLVAKFKQFFFDMICHNSTSGFEGSHKKEGSLNLPMKGPELPRSYLMFQPVARK
jgi:hypothetical protein